MSNTSTPSADECETIDILASDFLARYRDGERPSVEEYARRHSEYGDAIRRIFPLVASVERVKINEQVSTDGGATLAGRELLQLGDFRIVREIGRGGMGIVFEAHQESLDRTVAIKVLPKQSLLEDEALNRFRTEATTAAAMHHTNIVPIYGTGESEGSHYLVMQLVDGKSLDSVIESGAKTEFSDAARIGLQVADAIAYSHASGVLHRDIKPANILIEKDGTAQVTDFGLARSIGNSITQSRTVSGSLRYMAPERFAGISDERGDVYAIGLTMYELLAGRPAFEEIDAEHLIGAIAGSRIKSIQAIRPDVPADLATVIGKAIHVDSQLRYQSASDLRDDLRRFLADEPILARKTSIIGRLVRWSRRNPKLAAATAVAVLAMTTATIVSTAAYAMTTAANQRTNNALAAAEQNVDLALLSLNGVVDIVSQSPTGISVDDAFDAGDSLPNVGLQPSPSSARILERLQPIYERLSQQSPTRPDIILQMADASIQLARIQHLMGQTADSIKTLNASIQLLNRKGSRQDFRQPSESFDETIDEFRYAKIPQNDFYMRLARLNNELGGMHTAMSRLTESAQCYESAMEAASQLEVSDVAGQIELARAHLGVGSRPPHLRHGELHTSEQTSGDLSHINIAITILHSLKDAHLQNATTSILHARSLRARSWLSVKPRDRHEDVSLAVSILRDQLEKTPDDTNVRFELVTTLADVNVRGARPQGRINESSVRLREALEENDKLRNSNPENSLFSSTEVHLRHKLSAIARSQSRFDDAETMLSEAIQLQSSLILTWPDSIHHRCWRAMLYRSQATLYRQWGKVDAEQVSASNAKADIDSIGNNHADHPFVIRTRDAVSELIKASPVSQ